MSEVKIHKKRESYLYSGFKPEGAPDFYEVEYVLKSDYDDLKQLSDAFYLKQVQLENQNEELKYQLADLSEKYKIAMDKGVDVLSAEIKALKAKLEKAEAVISFYANKRHWDYTRIQMVEDMEMHGFGYLGGLKAREYMKGEG